MVCLFVHGNIFKKLPGEVTSTVEATANTQRATPTTLILPVDPTDRMCYANHGSRAYFSNNTLIGYVDVTSGASHAFPDPSQVFKEKMTGGHILEVYRSRLYAARDRYLTYSDATVLERKDTRKNTIPFPLRITMVKAVSDGIYVGVCNVFEASGEQETGAVYFMGGDEPGNFQQVMVSDEGPIEGMSITVDGDEIGKGAMGKTVYWVTKYGVKKGYPGGTVLEMQDGLFLPEDMDLGTAIYTTRNGYSQALFVGQLS
jgi:hypothetical protein